MKRLLILTMTFLLISTTVVSAKTSTPSVKLQLAQNSVTYDGEYRRIKVTWKKMKSLSESKMKPKSKTSYQIQRSKYKNFKKVDNDITLLNLKDTECNFGYYTKNFTTTYYIRVREKGGKWSNVVKAKGLDMLKTPVPRLEQNERTNRKRTIKLEWSSVKDADKYEVQRSIYSDFRKHEETVKSSTKRTYFKISHSNSVYTPNYGPASQTYYFRVRAINDDGRVSKWSGVVTAGGQYTLE